MTKIHFYGMTLSNNRTICPHLHQFNLQYTISKFKQKKQLPTASILHYIQKMNDEKRRKDMLDKMDNYFLKDSLKNIEPTPQDSHELQLLTSSKITPEIKQLIQEKTDFFKAPKQDKNKKCKNQTVTKWDVFQPYAFCKLPDNEKALVFHQLFDDYLSLKIKLNEQIQTDKKINSRNHYLQIQMTKLKNKNGQLPLERIKRSPNTKNETEQLKEEVRRLHEKIIALTNNKHKITPSRPQTAGKTQKVIFPSNQNIKAELQIERKQVRELLLIIDELKSTKYSLENQLKQKQQTSFVPVSRVHKNNFAKDNESQFQSYAFDLQNWKKRYQDLDDVNQKMTADKDRRIKQLQLQNIELKQNQRVKMTNSKFGKFTQVNNNMLEQKINDLSNENERLQKQIRRLVNLPFNQNNGGKNQIQLQDKYSRLQLAFQKLKDQLTKVKETNSKYLVELQYKTREGNLLKTENDKFKKQVKQFLQKETNPKSSTTEIDYDDYYRRLMGIVQLEGDDPVWRKYANLTQPSFNTMNQAQLRTQAQQLWVSKLELLAHLQKLQIQIKTNNQSSQSRIGLYLKDKERLDEELRMAHARLDEWTSMDKVGVRREVQLYEWAGVKYDDSISVFQADEQELKEIEADQNYFDLFVGQLNLDQTALLRNPSNKIKQITQMVSFLTLDFYNHDTQHSHFVEGNSRNIDNNFSFKVIMNQALIKFMTKQTVTLELWSPQGATTVLLGKGEIWLRDLVSNATKDVSAVIRGKCPFYQQDKSLIATVEYRLRMRLPIGSYSEWGREEGKPAKAVDYLRMGQRKTLEIQIISAINLPPSTSAFVYFSLFGEDYFTQAVRDSCPQWNYRKSLQIVMGEDMEDELKQNYLQFTVFDDDKPVNEDVVGVAKADLSQLIDHVQQLESDLQIKNQQFDKIGKLRVHFKWL